MPKFVVLLCLKFEVNLFYFQLNIKLRSWDYFFEYQPAILFKIKEYTIHKKKKNEIRFDLRVALLNECFEERSTTKNTPREPR